MDIPHPSYVQAAAGDTADTRGKRVVLIAVVFLIDRISARRRESSVLWRAWRLIAPAMLRQQQETLFTLEERG
jgi:hypothetical protein